MYAAIISFYLTQQGLSTLKQTVCKQCGKAAKNSTFRHIQAGLKTDNCSATFPKGSSETIIYSGTGCPQLLRGFGI
jgi:hypothetical protein